MTEPADVNPATSFGAAADAYERGRPGYPPTALSWLLDGLGAGPLDIADVGAGTGKLTRALLETGRHRVTAVDPDAAMLERLTRLVPRVATRVARAEQLPFDDTSVDLVVFGQSWHWVDAATASAEAGRVLRDEGRLGLLWNLRDVREPWVARLDEILGRGTAERLVISEKVPLGASFGAPEHARFEWRLPTTVPQLMDMAMSRSYLITASAAARERTAGRLAELFAEVERDAAGGPLLMPYVTHVYRATVLR